MSQVAVLSIRNTFFELVIPKGPCIRRSSSCPSLSEISSTCLSISDIDLPESPVSRKRRWSFPVSSHDSQKRCSDQKRIALLSQAELEERYGEHASLKQLDRFAGERLKDEQHFTTLMLKNIPCKYSQLELIDDLRAVGYEFDFVYLVPARVKRDRNLGYAFVNFCRASDAAEFFKSFKGRTWLHCPADCSKRTDVAWGKLQGFQENCDFFSTIRTRKNAYRPWIKTRKDSYPWMKKNRH